MPSGYSLVTFAIFIVVLIGVVKAIRVVPQQRAWVVERLGRFHAVLAPGLNFVVPFIDRVAYRHDLRETPLDVAPQVCITKDNTQLQVDGILYYQVTDPRLASYGSTSYLLAITQLAQTTLRSVIGRMELDRTFEERDQINTAVVSAPFAFTVPLRVALVVVILVAGSVWASGAKGVVLKLCSAPLVVPPALVALTM